jgi:hypothetical protein
LKLTSVAILLGCIALPNEESVRLHESFGDGSDEIQIRASLYASAFYQKQGYKKTTGIRSFHGLKIQPMKKKF